jgi:hypothetical protein
MYGYETWSLTLMVGYFESRVQKRIFGSKRTKAMGGLRKLHNGGFIIFTSCQICYYYENQVG